MRQISESRAVKQLFKLSTSYRNFVNQNFERRATNCVSCEVRGDCCTDAHFVNVQITKLEAVAIRDALKNLDTAAQRRVFKRADEAVEKYDLRGESGTPERTFACPLFEKEIGCLVHSTAKPLPCIHHACYENRQDLPPDDLLYEQELKIEKLNIQTYRKKFTWLPLPVWLSNMNPFR